METIQYSTVQLTVQYSTVQVHLEAVQAEGHAGAAAQAQHAQEAGRQPGEGASLQPHCRGHLQQPRCILLFNLV